MVSGFYGFLKNNLPTEFFLNPHILKFRFLILKRMFCICFIPAMLSGTSSSHSSRAQGQILFWPPCEASRLPWSFILCTPALASAPELWLRPYLFGCLLELIFWACRPQSGVILFVDWMYQRTRIKQSSTCDKIRVPHYY